MRFYSFLKPSSPSSSSVLSASTSSSAAVSVVSGVVSRERTRRYFSTATATAAAATWIVTLARQQQPPQPLHDTQSSSLLLLLPGVQAWTTPLSSINKLHNNQSRSSSNNSNRCYSSAAVFAMTSASSAEATADTASGSTTTLKTTLATPTTTTMSFRESVQSRLVNSWVNQLSSETPENLLRSLKQSGSSVVHGNNNSNKSKRPVFNGHYVPVRPTPLPNPRLLLYSRDVAENLLGFTPEQITTNKDDFVKFVSGNVNLSDVTWATPYALSIMGTRYTSNCPYGTGDAYGDGRAISIAEIGVNGVGYDATTTTTTPATDPPTNTTTTSNGVSPETCAATASTTTASQSENQSNSIYELQLKGAGTTPFHRGADGRAVLRSSVREFLASEAMHGLNVATTRALSLVVSETETVQRPWYRDDSINNSNIFGAGGRRLPAIPTMDDPRLAAYDEEKRRQIILQLRRSHKSDPDVMQSEPAAITCRVARSFTRIGHLDLFARRAIASSLTSSKKTDENNMMYHTDTLQWNELEQMIWHACYRENRETAYEPFFEQRDIASAAAVLLHESADKIATMVADWIRVGFAQGNFNADNCLVGGKTMDYGPFGWMEEYDPLFAKWTGSGPHFGFLNQPSAGYANYMILVESVVPVIAAARKQDQHQSLQQEFMDQAHEIFQAKVDEVVRVKLGFRQDQDVADELWATLEPLMRSSRVDWTLFFRELSYLVRDVSGPLTASDDLNDFENILFQLMGDEKKRAGSSPFYEELTPELRSQWIDWIESWSNALAACSDDPASAVAERMLHANPKYVLREWMLVKAYQDVSKGNEAELLALYDLIQRPYDEGSPVEIERYYRRAPEEALTAGGTAFMSCSS